MGCLYHGCELPARRARTDEHMRAGEDSPFSAMPRMTASWFSRNFRVEQSHIVGARSFLAVDCLNAGLSSGQRHRRARGNDKHGCTTRLSNSERFTNTNVTVDMRRTSTDGDSPAVRHQPSYRGASNSATMSEAFPVQSTLMLEQCSPYLLASVCKNARKCCQGKRVRQANFKNVRQHGIASVCIVCRAYVCFCSL